MLRFHERADDMLRGLRRAQHLQGIHRPTTEGLRSWSDDLSRTELALFEVLAGDLRRELDYPAADVEVRPGDVVSALAVRGLARVGGLVASVRSRLTRHRRANATYARRNRDHHEPA
jgi:hypothetical protein